MALGLVVTAQPTNSPPRFQLAVTGATGTSVLITRARTDGTVEPVRTAYPAQSVGGAVTVYDYEPPYAEKITYTVTDDTGNKSVTVAASLFSSGVVTPWLIHPGIPSLSMPVTVHDLGEETFGSNQGVHVILGRETPITITDGVRHSATRTIQLRTATLTERASLENLLADASPLLLQLVYRNVADYEYLWVSIGDVTRSRMVMWFGHPVRVWSLPCTITATPSGSQQSQRTFADLLADYATYSALKIAYSSYSTLFVGP